MVYERLGVGMTWGWIDWCMNDLGSDLLEIMGYLYVLHVYTDDDVKQNVTNE